MCAEPSKPAQGSTVRPPERFRLVYDGIPLPPFYAAEMLRSYVGRTVWVADSGGRTRCGELSQVPWVKEEQKGEVPPVTFTDEKPLFLRQIVCIAVYEPVK